MDLSVFPNVQCLLDDAVGCLLIHELSIFPENCYHDGHQQLIIRLQHLFEVHLDLPSELLVSRPLGYLFFHGLHRKALNEGIVLVAIDREMNDAFAEPKRGGPAEDIIHVIFEE